jgi:hypothetical protein
VLRTRIPTESDWPAILGIANRSVADVPGAGSQADWLENRRNFTSHGFQSHFVVDEGDRLVGYGAVEGDDKAPANHYRLFIVTEPDRLEHIGAVIHSRLEALLVELGAAGSWLVEYADDQRLVSFLHTCGYSETRRFTLPSGQTAIVLSKNNAQAVSPE